MRGWNRAQVPTPFNRRKHTGKENTHNSTTHQVDQSKSVEIAVASIVHVKARSPAQHDADERPEARINAGQVAQHLVVAIFDGNAHLTRDACASATSVPL